MIYRLAILALCFIAAVIKTCKNFHKHTNQTTDDKDSTDGWKAVKVRPWIFEGKFSGQVSKFRNFVFIA